MWRVFLEITQCISEKTTHNPLLVKGYAFGRRSKSAFASFFIRHLIERPRCESVTAQSSVQYGEVYAMKALHFSQRNWRNSGVDCPVRLSFRATVQCRCVGGGFSSGRGIDVQKPCTCWYQTRLSADSRCGHQDTCEQDTCAQARFLCVLGVRCCESRQRASFRRVGSRFQA